MNPTAKRTAVALVAAVALAAPFEGLRNYAYLDPVGIPTICYGSIKGVKLGDYKDTATCQALLGAEMLERVHIVERCVPGLPVNMLAAWASAIYNTGSNLVCDTRTSTAARMLKEGLWMDACRQLLRWDKAQIGGMLVALPGLTRRRQAEMELCQRAES